METAVSSFMRLFSEAYALLHRRRHADDPNLTVEGRALLMHLAWSGPLTIGDLALHVDRAQSVISESVTVLESHGLLARVRDPRDRRRTLVWITDRANEWLSQEREPLDSQKIAAVFEAMSPALRSQLLETFEDFIAIAQQTRDEDVKRAPDVVAPRLPNQTK
jgi:DNA-binding MarR family transcriptional regulator